MCVRVQEVGCNAHNYFTFSFLAASASSAVVGVVVGMWEG